MGEVARAEHGAEEGGGVEGVASLGSSDGEEAEGVGIEAVELTVMAEASDDGLGARERRESVLVRELRDQTTETGGVGEVSGVGVCEPRFFGFTVA